ncbi:MAG: FCD domain-containing protein, partial [Lachnospiraceae bacterium]|nr:FCD domain-containing protein [Lachnospiraceae bacterium]
HLLKDFHQYVQRVRKKTLSTTERSLASNHEHQMIMEAIKAKNVKEAEKLATIHIHNAYENMVKNGLKEAYSNE